MEISFVKTNAAAEAPAIDVQATVVPTNTDIISVPVAVDVAPVAAIPTGPANLALATAAPLPVTASSNNPVQLDEDNIGFEDVILPRLNIVQKVGDLSNIFGGGEIVLNKQVVVHEPANPSKNSLGSGLLLLTVLGFRRRQFAEKVVGGKRGLLLNSEAEVEAHNGTLNYQEWEASVEAAKAPGAPPAKRRFEYLATALVLVEKPEFLNDVDNIQFPYEFEGKYYQLALWSMKGVAYTEAAKKVFFTQKKLGYLKPGYTTFRFGITSALEEYKGGNFAYKPVVTPAGKHTDAFRQFCKDILGAGN